MKSRRGYTLLEVMITISLLSTIMLVTGATLHSLYRGSRNVRQRAVQQAALARLSLQLRSDVHGARRVELRNEEAENAGAPGDNGAAGTSEATGNTEADSVLRVILDDRRRVEYRIELSGVGRTAWDDERLVHRDLFRVEGETRFAWQPPDKDARRVGLRVWQGGGERTERGVTPEHEYGQDASSVDRPETVPGTASEANAFEVLIEASIGLLPGILDESPEPNSGMKADADADADADGEATE